MIRRHTIHDVPAELRRRAADQARSQLRGVLANPLLTPEQRQLLIDRMGEIDAWEAARVPVAPPPEPSQPPEYYEVLLEEDLSLQEKSS